MNTTFSGEWKCQLPKKIDTIGDNKLKMIDCIMEGASLSQETMVQDFHYKKEDQSINGLLHVHDGMFEFREYLVYSYECETVNRPTSSELIF